MSKIKFSDGMEFETDVPLHMEMRPDGLYVVGDNFLMAVENRNEGNALIKKLKAKRNRERER